MQAISICRNLLIVRNSQIASFHYTPVCYDKRKNKSKSDFKGGQQPSKDFKVGQQPSKDFKGGQQPSSKNYARFVARQKRADNKKALKSLLYHYGDQGTTFKNDEPWKVHGTKSCNTDSTKKKRSKSEPLRAEKIHNHRMRRQFRKKYLDEDDDDYPETIFQATFGGRFYTWSFDSWNGSSRRSSPQFDWRETFRGANGGAGEEKWDRANEPDSEDESCNIGLPADRKVLGLSPKGPLNLKDVKNAFHLSALKWHPDKHQGPTQAAAEEKFKLCVNAYKSLCSALSGA